MILHLVHDEKIINRTIDIFEEASPDDNFICGFYKKKRTRFVERRDCVVLYSEFRRNDYSFLRLHRPLAAARGRAGGCNSRDVAVPDFSTLPRWLRRGRRSIVRRRRGRA